jgi:thymidylate kinase
MIVSFSGIDGAGKSTQISELESWLHRVGFRTRLLSFWDDVVVFRRLRESISLKAFKGDPGIGSSERPVTRRDKNVTSRPVSALRFFLYFADALNLTRKVISQKKSDTEFLIFDRYIYDELANLPLNTRLAQAFVAVVLKLVPKPDLAFIVDADPAAAFARKPEYPLEFLHRNREAYLTLSALSGNVTILEPDSAEAVKQKIKQRMLDELEARNFPTLVMTQ